MKKPSIPNMTLFLKVLLYPFMLIMYFSFGLTIAGFVYLVFGLSSMANKYIVVRGTKLKPFQNIINIITDAVFNITAFALLVADGMFGVWQLLVVMILEMASAIASTLLVAYNYDYCKKKKFFSWIEAFIFTGILYYFFAGFQKAKYIILSVIFALYCLDVILKIIQYFILPQAKLETQAESKDTLLEKINDDKNDEEIAE